jgi:hypothetical protein
MNLKLTDKIKHIRALYRGVIDFRKEKGDVVTDCHSILARWRSHFSQLFIVHGVSDVR